MALIDKEHLKKFKSKANDIFNRTLDQHVSLAVTGLSRSGKTAFITSIVNQLINEGQHSELSFFNPVHQGRFIAAKRVPQKHMHIARFDYDGAAHSLAENPPHWPEPTKGISEMRLAIRYQPKDSLLKYATDSATLYLDITDYPGEWLLDLPMMSQTFEQWSLQMVSLLKQAPRVEKAQPWLQEVADLDPFASANEQQLADIAQRYTELLLHYRHALKLSLIQPGRFILPGDLEGAPILQFFPFVGLEELDGNDYQNAGDDTLIGMLRARFIEYKERVVRRFYKDHFLRFDRQIVLADCLTPLNAGAENFADLQQAIELILQSFDYGKSSLFSRLFSPRIDKLLFAATKADHITPEQHPALVALLDQLVYQTKRKLAYDEVEMKTLAVASVKATANGKSVYQGQEIPVLQGRAENSDKLTTVFPGTVPSTLPNKAFFEQNGFNFLSFLPLNPVPTHQALPHVRIDQVLQFLLGDKMA